VIEADLPEVLITITEQNFQDALKKWQNVLGSGVYAQKRTTSRVMVASRPKVSFDQMAAPVPEIWRAVVWLHQ
jgi:hypothetical protein